MSDPDLIIKLSERLKHALPGEPARLKMRARHVDGLQIKFPPKINPKVGAVLILLYQKSGQWYFPLIRRAEYDGVHGGQMALPGGKIEESDMDLVATAVRESEEEVGIDGRRVEVLGQLDPFWVGASNYEILPVIGYTSNVPQFVPEPSEVAEVVEAPVSEFLDPNNRKEKEIKVRDFPLIAPYFDVSSHFVWGATAMILNEFITIIKEL
jgi:8-oxo-dGTP pyrophosphatase MutT (NUDIX family)